MREREDDIRPWRYLSINHKTFTPGNLLAVDTETVSETLESGAKALRLKLWCAVHCRMEGARVTRRSDHHGTTAAEFWELVTRFLSKQNPLHLFAHNLGFDLTVLDFWRQLDSGLFTVQETGAAQGVGAEPSEALKDPWTGVVCVEDPPTIIRCRRRGTKQVLVALDTLNWWRTSVEELGKDLELPKLKMPSPAAGEKAWLTYCRRDVEIVFRSVIQLMQFIRQNQLGHFGYTAASQALAAFRHRFMPEKSLLVHGNRQALEVERMAYYGGRCQIFFRGKVLPLAELFLGGRRRRKEQVPVRHGPVTVLDVSGFYPSVMLHRPMPVRIVAYYVNPSPELVDKLRRKLGLAATVKIESWTDSYPVRKDGKSLMAQGIFNTALCGVELEHALNQGHVKKVYSLCAYKLLPVFDDFVLTLTAMRDGFKDQGKRVWSNLCKLMVNAIHGKLAQRAIKWPEDVNIVAPKPWGGWTEWSAGSKAYESYRSIAWMTQRRVVGGEAEHSLPIIGAWITAAGRRRIAELTALAGEGQVLYSDTDSLHVLPAGLDALELAGELADNATGKLRVVKTAQAAEYRAPKDYTLDGVDVVAGVKVKAVKLGPKTWRQEEWQRLASILHDDPSAAVVVKERTLTRRVRVPDDQVEPDGTVRPYVWRDDDEA